jgi:hypothetical protein
MNPGKWKVFAAAVMAAALVAGATPAAHAAAGSCSQPVSIGEAPVATDCLRILRVAVGTQTCGDNPCICRPRGTSSTRASDALLCLQYSVGQPVTINCNCGLPDVESSAFMFDPATAIADPNVRARFQKTSYYGAFSQDQTPAVADWTTGWTVKVHGNNKIWHPATAGGALNGATPTANGSCPTGTTDIGDVTMPAPYTGSMDVCELAGRYSVDGTTITLTNDNVYRINQTNTGGTFFGNGDSVQKVAPGLASGPYTVPVATHLVVQPGTLILGGSAEALIISRGSDITMNGTKADPIVMDSETAFNAWVGGNDNAGARGQWSGLVLTGFGVINRCNDGTSCDAIAEGLDTAVRYGGSKTDWNCGSIQYLVIDNPGFDIDGMGNDTNGLTVYGCDYPTMLSYIQTNNSLDDGMEFFGGSAVGDHFVSTNNQDDNFDTDFGFSGGVQFGLAIQAADDGDKGFECDNGVGTDTFYETATPISKPNFANITVLNKNSTVASGGGLSLRTWTNMNMWNVIQTNGKSYGIRSENQTATNRGVNPPGMDGIVLENMWIYNPGLTETLTNGVLRGTDATDKTNLTDTFNAGTNNVNGVSPGLDTKGYPSRF